MADPRAEYGEGSQPQGTLTFPALCDLFLDRFIWHLARKEGLLLVDPFPDPDRLADRVRL